MTPETEPQMPLAEDIYARRLARYEDTGRWYFAERARKAVDALQKHGFTALYAEDREEARQEILRVVPAGATVGAGGSMTLRQIGIVEDFKNRGHTVYDHWIPGLKFEEMLAIRRAQLTCDVFLGGANAITLDGQIICCDGVGNRVSAMTFGPGKVIIAAGANKIAKDLQDGLRRVREVAAPQALKEIGIDLPCTQTGYCHDCSSPQRPCRATLILERKPFFTDTTVVLVGEPLGY